jgi:predicted DNA-binding transcriptional regulator YafY
MRTIMDTIERREYLLTLIPTQPKKIHVSRLQELLKGEGYNASKRTIQRDLVRLSITHRLVNDEEERGDRSFGWSYHKSSEHQGKGAMDPIEALTLTLAQEYLEPLLPGRYYNRLKIFFDRAKGVIALKAKGQDVKKWRDRVRIVPQWQKLIPPSINEQAEHAIYEGLLESHQLKVKYKKRGANKPETRIINPLGIVLHGVVHRLICTMEEDPENPRHLPIHRFKGAEWNGNDITEPKDFNIDKFIEEENIGFLMSKKPLKLEVIFDEFAGFHLHETPISMDQKLTDLGEGKLKLNATVQDTSQLRWWLLGFGSQIEVVKPKLLRQEFIQTAKSFAKVYG